MSKRVRKQAVGPGSGQWALARPVWWVSRAGASSVLTDCAAYQEASGGSISLAGQEDMEGRSDAEKAKMQALLKQLSQLEVWLPPHLHHHQISQLAAHA